jgi:hypothetical protein
MPRCHRHHWPAAEPARAGALDAGRDAVKRQPEIGEVVPGKHVVQNVPQRLDRVQVGARTSQPRDPAPDGLAERLPHGIAAPQFGQACRRARRVGRHECAIDRAHRRADDHIGPDAGF